MQQDLKYWQNKTVCGICDGAESFVLADAAESGKTILYIASDGKNLNQTTSLLKLINPEAEVLEFPAWDTVPYDRVSPNSAIVAKRIHTLDVRHLLAPLPLGNMFWMWPMQRLRNRWATAAW